MPSITITTRDEVVAALQGATLPFALVVTGAMEDPALRETFTGEYSAVVIPGPREVSTYTRDGDLVVAQQVLVILRRSLPVEGRDAALAECLELSDAVERVFPAMGDFLGFASETTGRDPYDPDALRESGTFVTVFDPRFQAANVGGV